MIKNKSYRYHFDKTFETENNIDNQIRIVSDQFVGIGLIQVGFPD